jgi:hypothetical protein
MITAHHQHHDIFFDSTFGLSSFNLASDDF